jgi:hypothetical protein
MEQNKTGKYFKYAIGEIVLVVVGILIALSINNWNEERKAKRDFEFGLKEVYTRIQVNYFDLLASRERIGLQLTYIDSLLNYPDLIDPSDIPGMIQLQDYMGLTAEQNEDNMFKPFLQLNINDELQNELAKSLGGGHIYGNYLESNQSFNFSNTQVSIHLFEHLRLHNIPIRLMDKAPVFNTFIAEPNLNFYSIDELRSARKLLDDRSFIADLKSIRNIKNKFLRDIHESINIFTSTLDFLDNNYPNSKDYIEEMEIIGSGIPSSNWAIGNPMNKKTEGVFEIELELISGEIKFRTDKNYTYDWGGAQTNVKNLAFKGTNIPVTEGLYKIMIDINNNQYSIKSVENQ